jgi:hypothetical protein
MTNLKLIAVSLAATAMMAIPSASAESVSIDALELTKGEA